MIKNVAHLLFQRDVFEDGILYLSVKDSQAVESLIGMIIRAINFKDEMKDFEPKRDFEEVESNYIQALSKIK